MQAQQQERFKSLTVPSQTKRAFAKWIANFPNKQKAAEAAGFKCYETLTNIIRKGTCSSESLEKINRVLDNKTAA